MARVEFSNSNSILRHIIWALISFRPNNPLILNFGNFGLVKMPFLYWLDPPYLDAPQANEIYAMYEVPGTDESQSSNESDIDLATILKVPDLVNPPSAGPTFRRSPLGQQLNEESAGMLAQDALGWHKSYWLSLAVIAIMYGEEPALIGLLIEIEQKEIFDTELRANLALEFDNFLLSNRDSYQQHWIQQTLDCAEAKAFLRDVDKLLEEKVSRARGYLYYAELLLLQELRDGSLETAQTLVDKIHQVYRILSAEEARNQVPDGIHGDAQAPTAYDPATIEADNSNTDQMVLGACDLFD